MTRARTQITSTGDLEVVMLYENHSLLTGLISPEYYELVGSPPSEIRFHNSSAFGDFLVHVDELFTEGRANVEIDGHSSNQSLFGAAWWFCELHRSEAEAAGLYSACRELQAWTRAQPAFSFWCGELQSQIEFPDVI